MIIWIGSPNGLRRSINVRFASLKGNLEPKRLHQGILGWDTEIGKSLHKRIALVHQSVQMGNLQDPIAAERQIAQFQARIDELETHYLEALEEQEALELEEGIQQDNILNHQNKRFRITDALNHSSTHSRSIGGP